MPAATVPADARASWRAGLRAGVPFGVAGFFVSLSFGVLAREAGMPAVAAIVMSAVVFAGSAQFAALSILVAGGGLGAAVLAAAMMNSRYLPMGIALAPSLSGGPLKRAVQGQALVDPSWAVAARADGTFDRWKLFGTSVPQYVAWVGGTVVGVFGGNALGDPSKFGLDAVFPTFFLALLLAEMRDRRSRGVAALGALIALVLIPFVPPGLPVLVASLAALAGLRGRERGAA